MIGNFFQFAWEVKLIEWCQNNIPTIIIKILSAISNVGDTIFLVPVIAFFYLCYNKKIGKRIIYNTLMGLVLCCSIKNVFKRRRPYFDNPNIKCLKIVDKKYDQYDILKQGFSFPSMHSSNITVVSGTIYKSFKTKPVLFISLFISFVVGISRFVLGCHYPTDVLTGWLLGLIFVYFFDMIQDNLSEKYQHIILLMVGTISLFFSSTNDYLSSFGIAIGFVMCEVFDNRYCNFTNTNNVIRVSARLVLAFCIFLLTNSFLEYVIFSDLRSSISLVAKIYRVIRYAISTFISMGLSPLIYKYNILKIKENRE